MRKKTNDEFIQQVKEKNSNVIIIGTYEGDSRKQVVYIVIEKRTFAIKLMMNL